MQTGSIDAFGQAVQRRHVEREDHREVGIVRRGVHNLRGDGKVVADDQRAARGQVIDIVAHAGLSCTVQNDAEIGRVDRVGPVGPRGVPDEGQAAGGMQQALRPALRAEGIGDGGAELVEHVPVIRLNWLFCDGKALGQGDKRRWWTI